MPHKHTHLALLTNVLCLEGGRYILFIIDVDRGGPSLNITVSHYCQMQRDLKRPASLIKGGGRWKTGNSQAAGWERTDRRNISPSLYGARLRLQGWSLMRQSDGRCMQLQQRQWFSLIWCGIEDKKRHHCWKCREKHSHELSFMYRQKGHSWNIQHGNNETSHTFKL